MNKAIRKTLLLLVICLLSIVTLQAQKTALKSNLLYWGAGGSTNFAVEVRLAPKWTLDLYGGVNLLKYSKERYTAKHWLVQPELRFWTCEVYNGHFFGLHLHGAKYNVGGWDIPLGRLRELKDNRYEGCLYGAGLSYGYQWVLSTRWNIEASIGAGYAHIHYRKYPCANCGALISESNYNYFGVTRATLSIVYQLK